MFKKAINYALKYGALAAVICMAVAMIQYYGLEKSPFGRYKAPAFGINIIFILVATWSYRANNAGILSFTEGFTVGFLTNLFASIITAFCFYVFVEWIDVPFGKNQAILYWVDENIRSVERIKLTHIHNFGQKEYDSLLLQAKIIPTAGQVFIDEIVKKQLCIVGVSIISIIFRRHQFIIKNS